MFRWKPDGYLATWVNWKHDKPAGGISDSTGVMDGVKISNNDGEWEDSNLDQTKHFYCETIIRMHYLHCFMPIDISIYHKSNVLALLGI